MKRGINTGMSLQEIQSNDAPPVSVVGRACLIAIHDTVVGVNVIQASTDIEAIYGAGTLTDRLKHVQLAAGSSMYLVVASFPTAQVIGANIQSLMQTVIDLNHQVEFWVFNFPADSAMMVKIEEALTYFQNNARWYSSVSLSKDSRVLDLEGAVVADNADGTVAIPETAHGFSTDETLIISGSDNYDGSYPVLAASTADVIHITHAYTAETFEAGVVGEEKPSEYADAFGTEFETLSHNKGMLICQTTQEDHFGKIIGECLKQPLYENIARRDQGGVQNTDVDPAYTDAIATLIDHGAVVLKRDPASPDEVYINDDTVMWLSGEVRNWQDRRALCEAARQIYFYGNPLVNSNKFEKTDEGAEAAAMEIGQGVKAMRDSSPKIISDFDLTASWGANGEIIVDFSITTLNGLKIGTISIMLKQP